MSVKRLVTSPWFYILLLTGLVLLAYTNSLGGRFVSDDIEAIAASKNLGQASYLAGNAPLYLRNFFYFILNLLFGRAPWPYHSLNLIFHLGSVLLIYLILSLLAETTSAFFVAAIFAVHPLQSEAVAWISGGIYSQCSFFLLLSFWAFLHRDKGRRWLALSVGSFCLALISLEKALVFPLILFTYCWAYRSLKKDWKKLIPFFILGALWGLIYFGRVGQRFADLQTVHSQAPVFHNPFLLIPVATTSYLKLIFWPQNLTLYHSEMTFTHQQYALFQIIFLIFIGVMLVSFFRQRPLFFWLSFFLITLAPVLTPWGISWIVAERYVYLGALGIYAAVGMIVNQLSQKKGWVWLPEVILLPLLPLLAITTYQRNLDWQDEDHLWLAAAKTSPSSPNNHNNLGDYYSRHGDLESAVAEFKRAVELKPDYAHAFHNLANAYQKQGKIEEALANYQKALEFNPYLWQSHQNLATIYFQLGDYEKAKNHLQEALEIAPSNSFLHSNLGAVFLTLGDKAKAKEEFTQALSLDPANAFAQRGLTSLQMLK